MTDGDARGPVRSFPVVRVQGGACSSASDAVTTEEPLEIRLAGEPFVVTMRTPGHDEELAVGLLIAEGVVRDADELGRVFHCGRPGTDEFENAVDVLPAPGTTFRAGDAAPRKRGTLSVAACGVCGRQSIDDLLARCAPLVDPSTFLAKIVERLPASLSEAQRVFRETGGLHAAAIADTYGRLEVVREDVGRHNAVDKVIGRLALDHLLPATGKALVVSGRVSFEVVQKAAVAGIPLVVAISAVSSLAVETALRSNVTLVGFTRAASFVVYSHPERIEG